MVWSWHIFIDTWVAGETVHKAPIDIITKQMPKFYQ